MIERNKQQDSILVTVAWCVGAKAAIRHITFGRCAESNSAR
jgi:hypothetical protein